MISPVPPKGFAVPALRLAGCSRPARWLSVMLLGPLVFFADGISPAGQPPGMLPATRQFEVPQESDPFKLERIREQARENNERYRVRIALPANAFAAPPPQAAPGQAQSTATVTASGETSPGRAAFLLKLVCFFLGIVVWVLIARKLSPDVVEYVTGWLRSRMVWRTVPTKQLVTLLAEEQAVSEFQAALRGGTTATLTSAEEATVFSMPEPSPFPSAAAHIAELRRLLQQAAQIEAAAQRRYLLEALDHIHSLKTLAKPVELLPLRQMAGGLEMLLKQLTEKASNVTASTLRTVTLGVNLIEELCQPGLKSDLLSEPPLRLLVVDDETFSRFALSNSLKRGLTQPDVADNGHYALALAAKHTYDLIVLDVQMPGMDGFELCSRIHEHSANRTTPVIFVTSLRDFDARANSILCGGRDLIAKPFLTFELTVKALTLVAGERLRGRGRSLEVPVDDPKVDVPVAPPAKVARPAAVDGPAAVKSDPIPAIELKSLPLVPATVSLKGGAAPASGPSANFFTQARQQIDKVHKLAELALTTSGQRVQQEMIDGFFLGVHSLTTSAESAGQPSIALMSAALEGLLKKLLQDPANLSASTLQSVATAAALLQELCAREADPTLALAPPIRALVVDDDPVALRAVSNALQRTFSKPESAVDGKSALAMAADKPFDVIFLDVEMPDFDGFEVCHRIRSLSSNRHTPVVFLTGHDTAAQRAKSASCGGSDFLTKPSLASELNLKALGFALRGRLRTGGQAATSQDKGASEESAVVPSTAAEVPI